MSWDWTKEELSKELEERMEDGESKEQIFNFIWSIIQHAYDERDTAKSDRKNAAELAENRLFDRDSWNVIGEAPFTTEDIKKRRFKEEK